MLYLVNEEYPEPEVLTSNDIEALRISGFEITKRKKWITKMGETHILHNTALLCLQDKPTDRISMTKINKKLKSFCEKVSCTYKDVAQALANVSGYMITYIIYTCIHNG